MVATTGGWLFGWLLWPAIALVTAGLMAGTVQSVVLVHRVPRAWRWIPATAVGWLAGLAIALATGGAGAFAGLVVGAATGTAQWALLRREVEWAGWWIAVSALAWSIGLSLAPSGDAVLLPRVVLSGTLSSMMTGIALELLLRNRKPPAPTASEE